MTLIESGIVAALLMAGATGGVLGARVGGVGLALVGGVCGSIVGLLIATAMLAILAGVCAAIDRRNTRDSRALLRCLLAGTKPESPLQ